MTAGWAGGVEDRARRRPDQLFADALCGPDGTGDPAVLMPVPDVYPDALSAPMPDTRVPVVLPVDLAAVVPAAGRVAPPVPQRVPQPGRYGRNPPAARGRQQQQTAPIRRAAPAQPAAVPTSPVPATAPRPIGNQAAAMISPARPWSPRSATPTELAGWAKGGFAGPAPRGVSRDTPARPSVDARGRASARTPFQAPAPPTPRRNSSSTRRNRGSSIWAVLVFLVVIAFASGLAQQLIHAISELFNR